MTNTENTAGKKEIPLNKYHDIIQYTALLFIRKTLERLLIEQNTPAIFMTWYNDDVL